MAFANPEGVIQYFMLGEGMRVADFGAGSGGYTLAIARAIGGEGRVYAIDIQKDLLGRITREARDSRLSNVEVIWGDVERSGGTTLADSAVDAVIVSNLLFQVENRDAVAREAYRVLRPKGKILVVDWSDSFGGMGPRGGDVVSQSVAERVFEGAGFTKEKSIDAGEHHYGVIFRK